MRSRIARSAGPTSRSGVLLPEWANDPRGAITVRNLLQFSSGLAPAGPGDDPYDLAGLPEGARRWRHPRDRGAWNSRPIRSCWRCFLRRRRSERYASFVSASIWRPIGAGDAWLWLDHPGGTPHADCCLISRQGDWIRVGQLLLRDGNYRGDELIRPGWVAVMRSPATQ